MDDQADFTDEQLRGEAPPADGEPAQEAPEGGAADGAARTGPKVPSDLEQGLDSLKHVAVGVAARLFGPKLVNAEPERPTLSPEADKLVEDIGATVGHYLRAAGTAMKDHPGDLNEVGREASELAKEPIRKEVEDGWSPLVQGVRAFSEGLGLVVGELAEKVQKSSAKAEPPPAAQEPEEP